MKDPGLIEEAKKQSFEVRPKTGEELETMVNQAAALPKPAPTTASVPMLAAAVSTAPATPAQRGSAQPIAERVREAVAKGYSGDACGTCGQFALVRNGTCLKCDSCGSTSGCS